MKLEIGKLLEGIGNSIWVKEEVEKVAAERIAHCNICSHYSPNVTNLKVTRKDKFCTDCGCNMYLKTRALSASCPLGGTGSHFPNEQPKWTAVADDKISAQVELTPELKKDMDDYKRKLMNNQAE